MAVGYARVKGEDGDAEMGLEMGATSAEQSQRLLAEEDGEGDDDESGPEIETVSRPPPRGRWWNNTLLALLLLGGLMALLLLLEMAFLGHKATSTQPAPTSGAEVEASTTAAPTGTPMATPTLDAFRRPDSDYVLGTDWDYNAPPTVREYHWVIENMEANPDGVFKLMTVINGKFPGELIRCNEGDTVVVHVENRARNATALHWHGLFQNGTNHMDGTPGATQCAIAPGRSFRYEFAVRGQAGTYFYHGHQGADALDGLVGPLIVHARDEPTAQLLPYDTDRVVMVQDWYHDPSGGLLVAALEKGSESSPMPNGALINGAGVVDCSLHPGRRCDNTTARPAALDLPAGGRHRLRFIHTGGFAWLEINVDHHHRLPLTEMDGVAIEPSLEKNLLIAPGQRYSVVLTANATDADAFWLHARITTHCFAENTLAGRDNPTAQAIVRYTTPSDDAAYAARLPTTDNDAGAFIVLCRDMHTRHYAPYPAVAAPAVADRSYYLRVNLEIGDWQLQRGFFNQSSYRPNLVAPALHRAVDGLAAGNASYAVEGVNGQAFDARSELVVGTTAGVEVIDLVLQNYDEGTHPLHLHGHQLFVLGAGHGYFPGYKAFNMAPGGRGLLDARNTSSIANPTRRDVATVEGFGWTLVRFVADNPGVWRFHCHMVWHGDGGMAMLFLARTDVMAGWTVPPANRALCDSSAAELESGAAPKDSIWYGFDS